MPKARHPAAPDQINSFPTFMPVSTLRYTPVVDHVYSRWDARMRITIHDDMMGITMHHA